MKVEGIPWALGALQMSPIILVSLCELVILHVERGAKSSFISWVLVLWPAALFGSIKGNYFQ